MTRLARVRPASIWWLACPLFVVVFLLAITQGAVPVQLLDLPQLLAQAVPGTEAGSGDAVASRIVLDIRLPRALLVSAVGCLLAVSGAVMQGLFRNPLADPSLIGVTAGASAGASTVIVLLAHSPLASVLAGTAGISLLALGAFAGGALTVGLVYRLSTSSSGTSVATMLLAGIAITALAGAYSSLLEYLADHHMLRRISLWRMGGFSGADYPQLAIALAAVVAALLVFPRYANALNALLLGESEARHLGVNVQRLKLQLVLWVAIVVGVAVALSGVIAFVGLVVPHLVRLLAGPDHRQLVPLSAMLGALLMLSADVLARVVIAPAELPVGIITALLGAPFFISLLRHRRTLGILG